ncbi:hypothetical protein EJ08DRAFT_58228 [Tothia fuscella]|uniref:gamma-glutamylcyclotransferase n=1 Tax=Tothia fuscella TaxID=1048955 RepID=A0A9P4U190_9PEZI|nr:hypothetical protein EJ08DRAFT_58228 [Tothia fuscella]
MRRTLYFGYGSNLWLAQMKSRCPHSTYLGVGRLKGYRWQIMERGYANVVESDCADESEDYENVVYGLIYNLTASDEENLDINEGVPYAYKKEAHSVDFWAAKSSEHKVDVRNKPKKKDMLVYIDHERTKDSKPLEEYIVRMNHGIDDALAVGVPKKYIDQVLRKSIPAIKEEDVSQTLQDKGSKPCR